MKRLRDLAERRLEEAIRRVDPQLTQSSGDLRARARQASALAMAHVQEAYSRSQAPSQAYLDLLGAAAPWAGAQLVRRR